MSEVKRMTQEEAEECAAQIVNEAIAFNKVGIQLKNIWIGKILDHLILKENRQESLHESDRVYYNLFQHSKVINEIRNLNVDNGIGSLLDLLSNLDNSPIKRTSEKKPEKEENKIDFAGLWNRSSDEEKLTFFKHHNESQCPASTMYIARDYFRKLGLDHTKLMKW
jgi:hypothetical protein